MTPGSVSNPNKQDVAMVTKMLCVCVRPAENKEGQVRSEDFGKDIVSVQALLTKQVGGLLNYDSHMIVT